MSDGANDMNNCTNSSANEYTNMLSTYSDRFKYKMLSYLVIAKLRLILLRLKIRNR